LISVDNYAKSGIKPIFQLIEKSRILLG